MANYKLKSKGKWGEENKGICGFDCRSVKRGPERRCHHTVAGEWCRKGCRGRQVPGLDRTSTAVHQQETAAEPFLMSTYQEKAGRALPDVQLSGKRLRNRDGYGPEVVAKKHLGSG